MTNFRRKSVMDKQIISPSLGTDAAVGGAASTRINSNTMKLENTAIAGNKNTIRVLIWSGNNNFVFLLLSSLRES